MTDNTQIAIAPEAAQKLRASLEANHISIDEAKFNDFLESHKAELEKVSQEIKLAELVAEWTHKLSLGAVGVAAVASSVASLAGLAAIALSAAFPLSGVAGALALGGYLYQLRRDFQINQETEKLRNEIKMES